MVNLSFLIKEKMIWFFFFYYAVRKEIHGPTNKLNYHQKSNYDSMVVPRAYIYINFNYPHSLIHSFFLPRRHIYSGELFVVGKQFRYPDYVTNQRIVSLAQPIRIPAFSLVLNICILLSFFFFCRMNGRLICLYNME